MKLHVGCGDKHLEGYINIDIRYQPGVDQVNDIKFLRRYQSNSVEVIYACAVLEHFTRWEYKHVLKRWHEILIPGGVLRLSVPGFDKAVEHYVEHRDLRVLIGMLYGGQDYEQNFHHYIWDMQTLTDDLTEVGFEKIYEYDWRQTDHSDIDDFSQSYLPHMDKTHGKLMHLNVEAIKGN